MRTHVARITKTLFFLLVARPIAFVLLGLNVLHRERLPLAGPAVIVANHNSHLDTIALMCLFPLSLLHRVRPVAAADYFLANRFMRWFSLDVIGIIPIDRRRLRTESGELRDPHEPVYRAIEAGDIVIYFPEGTRGEPERLERFKLGLARIAGHRPETPVIPTFLHGMGKVLPRGEGILVPFFCDVVIGEPVHRGSEKPVDFVALVQERVEQLGQEIRLTSWD